MDSHTQTVPKFEILFAEAFRSKIIFGWPRLGVVTIQMRFSSGDTYSLYGVTLTNYVAVYAKFPAIINNFLNRRVWKD